MVETSNDPLLQVDTTRASLIHQLQVIWDEVGESDGDRYKMMYEIEQECLHVYTRHVDKANRSRAHLRHSIADSQSQFAAICSTLGEKPQQCDQTGLSLKEEHNKIILQIQDMERRKVERSNEFHDVVQQIHDISNEIHESGECIPPRIDEADLSLTKLEELQWTLHSLQNKKSDLQKQVQDQLTTLNSLCSVLGMDFRHIAHDIYPALGESNMRKDISKGAIDRLATAVQKLREVKLQRMQKLQDVATTLLELWNLMDTPLEEQQMFQNVTCNVAASEHEITQPNAVSVDFISHVEAEVWRLEELKASRMKELVLKKRSELEEICRKTHIVPEADSALDIVIEAIDSGAVDPGDVLEQIELRIGSVKAEAFVRKEIVEKVEKWLVACDEECWLEEYNRDEKRYNGGRGAHLTLKRAEKARALVNKLPAMVEKLCSKIATWEKERGSEFAYDGVRLLSMVEENAILREEKEQERRRLREQKKVEGQLIAEEEALYGSKPHSPTKKTPRMSSPKRLSMDPLKPATPSLRHPDKHINVRKPLSPIPAKTNDHLKKLVVGNNNNGIKKTSWSVGDDENLTPRSEMEYSFEERRAGIGM